MKIALHTLVALISSNFPKNEHNHLFNLTKPKFSPIQPLQELV